MVKHMKDLKEEQMNLFAEIDGYVYSGPQQYSSYNSPTEQMFNLVSQNYEKLSEIGKNRIPNLVASGINLDAKNEDNNKTILELAKENWGKDKSFQ